MTKLLIFTELKTYINFHKMEMTRLKILTMYNVGELPEAWFTWNKNDLYKTSVGIHIIIIQNC